MTEPANKAELLEVMKANRSIYTFDPNNKLWKLAFKMYREESGQRLDMDCGKCFQKVSDWLTKE